MGRRDRRPALPVTAAAARFSTVGGAIGRPLLPELCGTTNRCPQYRHRPVAPAMLAATHIGPPHAQSK